MLGHGGEEGKQKEAEKEDNDKDEDKPAGEAAAKEAAQDQNLFSAEEQKFMDIIEKSSDGEDNKNEAEKAKIPANASFSFEKEMPAEVKAAESQKSEEKGEEQKIAPSANPVTADAPNQVVGDRNSVAQSEGAQCRVCWDDECTEANPLLQICQCRGGVQFIHYTCLKSWVKTKEFRFATENYTSIYWRQFQCDICKATLPYVFKAMNGLKYPLIEIPEPDTNHMVLESLTLE